MKSIIIYESPFGSVELYARTLAQELNIPITAIEDLEEKNESLSEYDLIIVGSSYLSGDLIGSKKIMDLMYQYPDTFWVLYTVGISNPKLTDFKRLLARIFPRPLLRRLATFHYRGRISSKRFLLMYLVTKKMSRKPGATLDEAIFGNEEWDLLREHGATAEPEDLAEIKDLITYVHTLEMLN